MKIRIAVMILIDHLKMNAADKPTASSGNAVIKYERNIAPK